MKAGVYHGPDDIRIEEMNRPELPPGGILVSIKTCGLCGTDVAKYRHQLVKPPVVLGHEVVGEVIEVDPAVRRWKSGDRVIIPHHIPCFVCRFCRHGNFSACEEFRPNRISPGGFAEVISVQAHSVERGVLRIPDSMSWETAAMVESMACCLRAFKRCRVQPGDSIAVIGCGPVGLMNLLLFGAMGAGKIIGIDIDPARLDAAREFGADDALDARDENLRNMVMDITGGLGVDIAFVCVGSAPALQSAFGIVRRGGMVHVFAECPPGEKLTIDPNDIYHEATLAGTYSSSPVELTEALELIAAGRVDVGRLISHRMPLDDLPDAFRLAVRGGDALKIMINI